MKHQKQSIKVLATLALAASDTREDTLQSVIINTLFETENTRRAELIPKITELYHFEPYKPEVDSLVEKLKNDGLISVSSDVITLSESERTRLNALEIENRTEETKRFQNFKNFVNDSLVQNIDIHKLKVLYSVFIEYLYNSFYEFGIEALQNFIPTKERPDLDNEDFLQESYSKLRNTDKNLCDVFRLIIDKFPDYVSRDDLSFLNDISLKTQSFVSLGVKPSDVEELSEMKLIDWVLYLDTNVIYSLLRLHSHPENESCQALIKLINDNSEFLKIKLRYSELTIRELLSKKNDFSILDNKLSDSAIRALLGSDKLDAFSKEFYTNLLNNRSGTLHPSEIIDLSNITLKSDKIEVSRSNQKLEHLGEKFLGARTQEYLNYIQTKNDLKQEYCKEKNIHFRPYYRSDKQAYHDISLRELIIDYRFSSAKGVAHLTFNNIKYYAITLDDLLIQFDQHLRRSQVEIKSFPVFFKPSFLLSKLSAILPIKTDDYKKAYFRAITSRGFNKDIRKSNDIQRIVTYLKQRGIDNNEVIYNLISEDLFLEKYHEKLDQTDFNQGQYIEDELNRLFLKKQEELESSKKALDIAKTTALDVSSENIELNKRITELSNDLVVYSNAAKSLSKKVDKLESDKAPVVVQQGGFNFEAAEKQKELDLLQSELSIQKKRTIQLENEQRKPLRENYIYRKIFFWRLKSFVWIVLLPVLLVLLYYTFNDSLYFPAQPVEKNLETFLTKRPTSIILVVFAIVYQAIFIAIFSSKFAQTNKSKFIESITIPENFKEKSE